MSSSPHQVAVRQVGRRPFVLDVRPLGRRPGSMWEGEFTIPATEAFGLDLISVPPGIGIELQLRLESVLDGVLGTGSVTAPVVGECARCLDEVQDTVQADFVELWSYPEQADRHERTAGTGQGQDEDVIRLDGDLLDLEQVIRDAVGLALPPSPLCRDDCPGLCSECGAHLDEVGPDHGHDQVDPRWSALGAIGEATDSGA